MVAGADPVLIRGPQAFGAGAAPLLLQRTDARFMSNVRDELAEPLAHARLKATSLKPASAPLKLFQPVHRTFYVALTELVCDVPGRPRLDPNKIESAGLVVRRVQTRRNGQATRVYEGWMRAPDGTSGWAPLADPARGLSGEVGRFDDPDAARRRTPSTGSRGLDAQLALRRRGALLSESITDLFVLPPKVSEATGSTLLFGVLPTTSLATRLAPAAPAFGADEPIDLHPFFSVGKSNAIPWSSTLPNKQRIQTRPAALPSGSSTLGKYTAFLQQVVVQYDLLGDSPTAAELRELLNQIQLPFEQAPKQRGLADHIVAAANVLLLPPIDEQPGETLAQEAAREASQTVQMPSAWFERPSDAQLAAIRGAIGHAMRSRLDAFGREETQFGTPGDRFEALAFVRVRRPEDSPRCPPELFWTAQATAEFEIAPWYETGPGPMPVVQLPDPFAPGGLARFKPNVGFALPASIADVVRNNSPQDLLEGNGKRGSSLGIEWLCGFNIPLITLCAFIVLSLFLSLFQIIFWWLAFIKICIPIPKRQG